MSLDVPVGGSQKWLRSTPTKHPTFQVETNTRNKPIYTKRPQQTRKQTTARTNHTQANPTVARARNAKRTPTARSTSQKVSARNKQITIYKKLRNTRTIHTHKVAQHPLARRQAKENATSHSKESATNATQT
jgi:hypothetical protein